MSAVLTRRPLVIALAAALALSACGGGDNDSPTPPPPLVVPAAPAGLGAVEQAPVPATKADGSVIPPFVDHAATNQRDDARFATLETNAGVRVVEGFLDLWTPSTLLVDAGSSAVARDGFPAVVKSNWTGEPGDPSDGTPKRPDVLSANIQYVVDLTTQRTAQQELAAYLDDRRHKAYSISDGMGALAPLWREAAEQVTSIVDMAPDATTRLYNDTGNDVGVRGSANLHEFGTVTDVVGDIGGVGGSTEPAKRFYKYARPWRWNKMVRVVPALVPAKSGAPGTDGGFISGHSAEATRRAIAFSYVVPERFQEIIARGQELGENRIYAGMHSPLDVIGGRLHGQAVAAASLATGPNSVVIDTANGQMPRRTAGYQQAHATLMKAANVKTLAEFYQFAHSQGIAADRFADHATNKAEYRRRLTFGFTQIGDKTQPAVVPKGAEVLLETRLPYLSAEQRRVVLKTTALPSGYPVMDDAEGWGRLNLFDAADGYGRFDGDVFVTMDAGKDGFHANDSWNNDISGLGMLTKDGSGTLRLTGVNSYTGGTHVIAGVLQADSAKAFGNGDLYLTGGTVFCNASSQVIVTGAYTQLDKSTLELSLGNEDKVARLSAGGVVTLAGGTLKLSFKPGSRPAAGSSRTITLITAKSLKGTFKTITVDGFKATPTYTNNNLSVRIES